jgi:diguanylate cyclase (GGDEF)-like protein
MTARKPLAGEVIRAKTMAAALAAGTTAIYFWRLSALHPAGTEHPLVLPCATFGVWWAGIQVVQVKNKDLKLWFGLDAIPVLVAIAFLSPGWALTAILTGKVASQLYNRRSGHKAAVNVAATMFSASLATLVCDTLSLGPNEKIWKPAAYVVVLAALATYFLVKEVMILAAGSVLAWAWRRPPLNAYVTTLAYDFVVCACGIVVGVNMIPLDWWQTPAFFAMAGFADIYWRKGVFRKRRTSSYQQLLLFARRLARHNKGALDLVGTVLEGAQDVVGVKKAVLVLPHDPPLEGTALCCTLASGGEPQVTEGFQMNELGPLAVELNGLIVGPRQKMAAQYLDEAHGFAEAMVAPLYPGNPESGYLLVTDKNEKQEAFGKEDLRALKAVASHAAISLRRGGLVDKLHEQSDARAYEATHDSVTGLANRAAFVQRLRAVCHEGAGDLVALVLFDFDRFKQVNDTLGHRAGDEILTQVAQRLKSLQGRGKMVARIGGDEFVVLVEAAGGDEPGLAEAMEVMAAFADPVEVDGLTLDVRASIGVAASLAAKTEPMALFRHAEIAMYQAKAKGTNIEFYESQKDRASLRRLTMAGHLRRAIEEGLLNLHYQPVVDLTTGKAVSCEALARWVHPELGTVGPDEFIPAAERAGLIVPLTWWAVETALHDVAIWRKSAPSLTVAVNLSPVALLAPDLAQRVDEALSRAGLGPEALRLELTETSVLADLGSKALQELAELGVGLSLDDFGTGYSSLSRLRQLPFDEVKIDRCFVTDMDENDEAVVRSVIELARGLDKLVTAEGVEDEATLIRLAELGCDSAQGFYISRPLPARQLERALKKADRWPSGVAVAGRSAATA